MAIPVRRPRSAEIMLRNRLLLPHSRLGSNTVDLQQALPQSTGARNRERVVGTAAKKDDGDIQAGVSHLRTRLVPTPRRVLASRE